MLKTPLIPVGFSGKYPTKTGALMMPGIRGKFNFEKGFLFFSFQVAWFVVTEIKCFCVYSTFTFVELYAGFTKSLMQQVPANQNDDFSRAYIATDHMFFLQDLIGLFCQLGCVDWLSGDSENSVNPSPFSLVKVPNILSLPSLRSSLPSPPYSGIHRFNSCFLPS